jgi:hypothetical protein
LHETKILTSNSRKTGIAVRTLIAGRSRRTYLKADFSGSSVSPFRIADFSSTSTQIQLVNTSQPQFVTKLLGFKKRPKEQTISCRYMAQQSAALCWQAHFLEKLGVSRIVVQIFEKRIAFDLGQSGIA